MQQAQTVHLWQLPEITIKKAASTNGGEFASACPYCGGHDRFRIWPNEGENGKFWCRQCGKRGDLIDYLQQQKGMSFQEACEVVGKTFTKKPRLVTDLSWRKPQPVQQQSFRPATIPEDEPEPQELLARLPQALEPNLKDFKLLNPGTNL